MFVAFKSRHVKLCIPGISGQRRPKSVCACAQSDEDLYCPHTESLATETFTCIDVYSNDLYQIARLCRLFYISTVRTSPEDS